MIIALSGALVAFNVKSFNIETSELIPRDANSEVDVIDDIFTFREELPEPPAPEPEPTMTEFKTIDNDEIPETDFTPIDFGDNANRAQMEYVAPATTPEIEDDTEDPYVFVEVQPSFPGGEEALFKFMSEHINYPENARANGIEGKVYISFIVEKDGSISNVRAVRDLGGGLADEAVRVVKSMPKWNPGRQMSRTVRTKFTLPVDFILR